MTTRVTFDTACTQEQKASNHTGMRARAVLLALAGCLTWLPFSSAAEAAPFQKYRNGVCASSICNIDFPVVPAGRRLDITNASCYLRTSGDVNVYSVQLLVLQGAAGPLTAVTLVPEFIDNTSAPFESVFSANHSVFAFANAGQRFRAYAELKKGTFSQFACHISGQLQDLP